jgi:hypothetical protein
VYAWRKPQCSAPSKTTGQRCRRRIQSGSDKCRFHQPGYTSPLKHATKTPPRRVAPIPRIKEQATVFEVGDEVIHTRKPWRGTITAKQKPQPHSGQIYYVAWTNRAATWTAPPAIRLPFGTQQHPAGAVTEPPHDQDPRPARRQPR